jgi:phage replication-related protein YjqB (UPF0714/DUF867 family)
MHDENPAWIQKLQQPPVLIAGLGLIGFLILALVFAVWRLGVAGDRYEMLEKRAADGFLQAPSSTRTVKLDQRETRRVSIDGGGFPQRVDLLVNAASKRYARFRVTLLRNDGTLILHADRMIRDSNNDLKLSFNTSILPNGEYRIRVEGYARNGELERLSEAQMLVSGR